MNMEENCPDNSIEQELLIEQEEIKSKPYRSTSSLSHILAYEPAIPLDKIYPFRVSEEQCKTAMLKWLVKNRYVCRNVLDQIEIVDFYGVFLPSYSFDIKYSAEYSAMAGYYRKETHTEYIEGQLRARPVTKVEKVLDWQPYKGVEKGSYSEKVFDSYCSKTFNVDSSDQGAKSFSKKADSFFEKGGENSNITSYDSKYTDGYITVPFVLSAESAYEQKIKKDVDKIIERDVKTAIPGDRKDALKWDADIKKEMFTYYKPFWIIKYTYNAKCYIYIADGTDETSMIGTFPQDEIVAAEGNKHIIPFFVLFAAFIITALIFFFWRVPSTVIDSDKIAHTNTVYIIRGVIFWGLALSSAVTFITGGIGSSNVDKQNAVSRQRLDAALSDPDSVFNRYSPMDPDKFILGA